MSTKLQLQFVIKRHLLFCNNIYEYNDQKEQIVWYNILSVPNNS